jgi:hypothetical protein
MNTNADRKESQARVTGGDGSGASRPIRRNMIILMNQGVLSVPLIAAEVGEKMLDYHLHRLELAGLIELSEGKIVLTEAGVAYGGLVRTQKALTFQRTGLC